MHSTEWNQGWAAYWANIPSEENPYSDNSENGRQWLMGWDNALAGDAS